MNPAFDNSLTLTAAIGEDVEWAGKPVKGIYAMRVMVVDVDAGVPVEAMRPTVSVSLHAVPKPKVGDAVHVRGSDYTARSIQPDGYGMVVAVLSAPKPTRVTAGFLTEDGATLENQGDEKISE